MASLSTAEAAAPPVSMEKGSCKACFSTEHNGRIFPVPSDMIPAAGGVSWDVDVFSGQIKDKGGSGEELCQQLGRAVLTVTQGPAHSSDSMPQESRSARRSVHCLTISSCLSLSYAPSSFPCCLWLHLKVSAPHFRRATPVPACRDISNLSPEEWAFLHPACVNLEAAVCLKSSQC